MTTAVAGFGLGERVRALRLGRQLTQVELSRRLGTEPGYVGGVENGKVALPSADIVKRLARELGTTVADLLEAAGYLPAVELRALGDGIEDPQLVALLRRVGEVEDERLQQVVRRVIVELLALDG